MSLADDLLLQAKDLLNRDLRKPKQANLRRSVSTAYYSLFYLLIDEVATTVIGGGNERKHLRGYVMRTISHKTIANVCKVFANKNPGNKIKLALAGHEVPDDLADIALVCHNLQDQRHEADYNFRRLSPHSKYVSNPSHALFKALGKLSTSQVQPA